MPQTLMVYSYFFLVTKYDTCKIFFMIFKNKRLQKVYVYIPLSKMTFIFLNFQNSSFEETKHKIYMSQCRFEPWSGKIPHGAEQLGPCATTTEPAL